VVTHCPNCGREMGTRTSRDIGGGEREVRLRCRHCGAKVVKLTKPASQNHGGARLM